MNEENVTERNELDNVTAENGAEIVLEHTIEIKNPENEKLMLAKQIAPNMSKYFLYLFIYEMVDLFTGILTIDEMPEQVIRIGNIISYLLEIAFVIVIYLMYKTTEDYKKPLIWSIVALVYRIVLNLFDLENKLSADYLGFAVVLMIFSGFITFYQIYQLYSSHAKTCGLVSDELELTWIKRRKQMCYGLAVTIAFTALLAVTLSGVVMLLIFASTIFVFVIGILIIILYQNSSNAFKKILQK